MCVTKNILLCSPLRCRFCLGHASTKPISPAHHPSPIYFPGQGRSCLRLVLRAAVTPGTGAELGPHHDTTTDKLLLFEISTRFKPFLSCFPLAAWVYNTRIISWGTVWSNNVRVEILNLDGNCQPQLIILSTSLLLLNNHRHQQLLRIRKWNSSF